MWRAGLMERMPASVDHTIVAVEEQGDGWSVFMHDRSVVLLRADRRLDRSSVAHVLGAMAEMHRTFWDEPADLCSIEDRYHLLSPRTISRELAAGHSADGLTRGWEAFWEHVPGDVADVIRPLVDDPIPLANQLRTCPQTLIHGDLRLDNLGLTDAGIVLLDWGERSGIASPAVELMWFLGFDALRLDCTREEVVSDFRSLYGDRVGDRTMDLAFVGGLVHLGCHFGLGLLGHSPTISHLPGDAAAKRAAAEEELDWWLRKVEDSLGKVSPI